MTKDKGTKAQGQEATGLQSHSTAIAEQDDVAAFKSALLAVIEQHRAAWEKLPQDKAFRLGPEGQFVAVVMSYQGFDALLERLEDLEDAENVREALEAQRSGKETTVPWEKLEADLEAEGLFDE